MARRKQERDDHLFVFIGDKAFTLEDLGPAADMSIADGFQSIIDQGLLGEELKGRPWHDIIKSSFLRLDGRPPEEEVLQRSLYDKYKAAERHCQQLSREGTLTQEHKDDMMRLRRDWRAATKLAKPNPPAAPGAWDRS